jgi:hypothetical protein
VVTTCLLFLAIYIPLVFSYHVASSSLVSAIVLPSWYVPIFLFASTYLFLAHAYFRAIGRGPQENYLDDDLPRVLIARKATKPEDKVFSVHSVLQRLKDHEIPPPDHSKSIGELYLDLCIQLFPVYSTSVLTMAALKSIPGQPSWVPDWSQAHPALEIYFRQSTRDLDCGQANTDEKPIVWDASATHNLKVRGCEMGKISSVHRFQATDNTYLEEQRQMHLANLEELLVLMNHFNTVEKARFLHGLFPSVLPSALQGIHQKLDSRYKPLMAWTEFIFTRRSQTPGSILRTLHNTRWDWWCYAVRFFSEKGTLRRADMLNVHLNLLQYLATSNQTLFWFNLDPSREEESLRNGSQPHSWERYIGICSGDVVEGDTVTWLDKDGADKPQDFENSCFITRSNGKGSVLVSPAVLAWGIKPRENWDGSEHALDMIDLY